MSVSELIKQRIEEDFQPEYMELVNESQKHAGHVGDDGTGESHFKLMVVSSKFEGFNRIQRHRLVHTALKSFIGQRIHALAVRALTPSEYKAE